MVEQKSHYELQLKELHQELGELQDIRDRISVREEELETALLEKEETMNRLSVMEHQLATERVKEEGQTGDKEQQLLVQLHSQRELCETLKARSAVLHVFVYQLPYFLD